MVLIIFLHISCYTKCALHLLPYPLYYPVSHNNSILNNTRRLEGFQLDKMKKFCHVCNELGVFAYK